MVACEPFFDVAAVLAALALTVAVEQSLPALRIAPFGTSSDHFAFLPCIALALIVLSLLERVGVYRPARSLLRVRETSNLLSVATTITVALAIVSLLHLPYSMTLLEAPLFGGLLFLCLLFGKTAVHALQQSLHRRGITSTPIAIMGAGLPCRRIYSAIVNSPRLGMWPVMVINPLGTKSREETVAESGYRVQQSAVVLAEQLNYNKLHRAGVEKLLIVAASFDKELMQQTLEQAASCGIEIEICSGDVAGADAPVECVDVDGIMIWRSVQSGFQFHYQKLKRVFDSIVVCLLLIVFSPLMLAIAAALKFTSPGPVFFRQTRVGKRGNCFTMLKFRSMHQAACRDGFSPKSGDDPRISRIGRLLRKTSLDELPQLFNVLRGDMSLVGPRPEMPFIVNGYTPLQLRRLEVSPGITGLWQISAHRKDLIHDNMQYDLYYVRHQGIFLDLAILIHTAIFAMKGV
jgi:exopolysaccharide biosynthesis polyprenyl glycosylphosphotransferase